MKPRETTGLEVCAHCGRMLLLHRRADVTHDTKDRVWCFHCWGVTVPGRGFKGQSCPKEFIVVGTENGPLTLCVEQLVKVIRKGLR